MTPAMRGTIGRWAGPQLRTGARTRLFHKVVRLSLILASTSPIRSSMLNAAGVDFEAAAPGVDEQAIKGQEQEPGALASKLAAAKALAVAARHPGAWTIGSDSVVSVDGRLFDKPRDRAEAAEHLRFFSGKPMHLTSAVALAHRAAVDWQHTSSAVLQVRTLSDLFIADYLDAEWPEVGYTVGVFRLEARGVLLFDRIDGDHFTVLGMPLIQLLGALRERGLLPS